MGISLRLVVLMMVVVVGVAATLIALLPVRSAGLSAVRTTADYLRLEISDRLALDVLSFFQAPQYAIASLRDQHQIQSLNTSDIMSMVPAAARTAQRFNLPVGVGTVDDELVYIQPEINLLYIIQRWQNTSTNQTHLKERIGQFDPVTFAPYLPPASVSPDATFQVQQRVFWAHGSVNQSWGPVYVQNYGPLAGGFKTTISPGGPLRTPITGALEGVAAVDLRNDLVVNYFQTVQIAKTGRAILLDTQNRACLAGNWNESMVVPTSPYSARLASVSELTEPLLARAAAALGEDTIFNATLPYRATFGDGANRVYVDLVQISDQYGLDLRLLVLIPEKDFLEEVNDKVNTSVGATCGAVAGLLLAAFVITAVVLQPLSTLEERMYSAASFQDTEDADSGPSLISEVANIQTAFKTLSDELQRVKSYLPASILAVLEAGSDEEMDEEEEGDLMEESGLFSPGSQSLNKSGLSNSMNRSVNKSGTHQMEQSGRTARMSANDDVRSTASSRRMPGAGAAAGARGLFTTDAIAAKRITVVTINMLGSHEAADIDWRDLKQQQEKLLTEVQRLCKVYKGVMDTFQGDHVTVTFNAVLTVASHQSKAAHFALALQQCFDTEEPCQGDDTPMPLSASSPKLTIGIASGECLVGNMGIEGCKRFNIIGPAFTTAQLLERLCKQFRRPILANTSAANVMGFNTHVEAVGAYKVPGSAGSTITTVLYTPTAVRDQGNDEWMYDLKEAEEKDMGLLLNKAWGYFVAGNTSAVKEAADKLAEHCEAKPEALSQTQRASLDKLRAALAATPIDGSTLTAYLQLEGAKYAEHVIWSNSRQLAPVPEL